MAPTATHAETPPSTVVADPTDTGVSYSIPGSNSVTLISLVSTSLLLTQANKGGYVARQLKDLLRSFAQSHLSLSYNFGSPGCVSANY